MSKRVENKWKTEVHNSAHATLVSGSSTRTAKTNQNHQFNNFLKHFSYFYLDKKLIEVDKFPSNKPRLQEPVYE